VLTSVCPQLLAPYLLQVLDEIGVDLSALMGAAPQRKVAQQQPAAAATSDSELQDLQARLAMLKS
jgi:hypothetical protein